MILLFCQQQLCALLGNKSFQQLFYAPSFSSRIFSSISFPILATVSNKLFILPFSLLIILVYTRVCKVDLQNLFIYLFSEKLCPAYKEKLETVSNVLESQMLNNCVPSLTAALLPTAVILYSHSVFRVDKIPACILLWYINL